MLHIFLSIWAVCCDCYIAKAGVCFWLKLRSAILQDPFFPVENLLMALFQTEKPKRSDKISELAEARLYLLEEMQNNILLYFIVLSVV